MTIAVGLLMLGTGLLLGYFGRPLIRPQPPIPASVASADTGSQSAASDVNPAADDRPQPTLMEGVVAQTRHFKGDPDAPITIVEFGDFK
jgi:hypothetical protein